MLKSTKKAGGLTQEPDFSQTAYLGKENENIQPQIKVWSGEIY
jgi:hypothetical protein